MITVAIIEVAIDRRASRERRKVLVSNSPSEGLDREGQRP
jgi:hypothetical protein